MADEFLQHERSLRDNFYGKFVLRNCRIDHFKRKKGDWMEKEKRVEVKKALFADILEGAQSEKRNTNGSFERNSVIEKPASAAETEALVALGFGPVGQFVERNAKKKESKKLEQKPKEAKE